MSIRPPLSNMADASGLVPAALLGLLGLPLIIHAGPTPAVPTYAYAIGLILTPILGVMTIGRTTGRTRLTAIVATVLLTALCATQIALSIERENTAGWKAGAKAPDIVPGSIRTTEDGGKNSTSTRPEKQ